MQRSLVRLSGAAGVAGTTSPYCWVNPAQPGPSKGPLAGKRIAIKDNISYTGAPTTGASAILDGYVPPFDATCVTRLLDAGAHISGKTKLDEFGMGSGTTHMRSDWVPPHNLSGPTGEAPRMVGGSSGGSAAAVAEGSSWAALGTDTGGSVRLPAAYCGVVGLKPSYGLVSRHGVLAYADSLDTVGVIAGRVSDAETVFDVISAPDLNDMTCASSERRATFPAPKPLKGLRIGLPIQTHVKGAEQLDTELLDFLRSEGAEVRALSMPSLRLALPAYYVLSAAEAASNLGRYGGSWYGPSSPDVPGESGAARRRRLRTEGFGEETRKRILAGTYALTADAFRNSYLKALHLRRQVKAEFDHVFGDGGVDVILHPTAVGIAPRLDGKGAEEGAPGAEYLQDTLTVPASLAGLPALSVPSGRKQGWPVGVSATAPWGAEKTLFELGRAVERWNEQSGQK